MSTSTQAAFVADTTVDFGHSGAATIKLMTESGEFPSELLEQLLAEANPTLSRQLHDISHFGEKVTRRNRNVTLDDFDLRVCGVTFSVQVSLKFGQYALDTKAVRYIIEQEIADAIFSHIGSIIKFKRGSDEISLNAVLMGSAIKFDLLKNIFGGLGPFADDGGPIGAIRIVSVGSSPFNLH